MKIALDLTPLMPAETGVDRYLLNLVRGLARTDLVNQYLLFIRHCDEVRLPELDADRWRVVTVRCNNRWQRLLFQQLVLPRKARREGANLLHSPAFLVPLRAPGLKQVLSIHDVTFFTAPEVHNRMRRSRWFRWLVAQSIRRADHLLVPSRWVRDELLGVSAGRDPRTVHVTEYGLDHEIEQASRESGGVKFTRPGLPARYLLFVGTLEPRKNLHRLLEAYRLLLQEGFDRHLVLAGQWGWDMDAFRQTLQDPAFAGRVHVTGYLSQPDLVGVYRQADLLVYPSIGEGFGFPPLEAMALGIPVLVSATSALGEIYRDAALTVNPADVGGMASAIRTLASDQGLRQEKRRLGLELAQQLNWMKTAEKTLDVYRAACEGGFVHHSPP